MASTTTKSQRTAKPQQVSTYDSQGYGNSDVIAAVPATLLSFFATNKGASTLYIMIFDAASVGAATYPPKVLPVPVAAGAIESFNLNEICGDGLLGLDFTAGIVWVASTSPNSLVADTTNSVWVTGRFF